MNHKKKLSELERRLSPGAGITLNVYLDGVPTDRKPEPGDVLITVTADGAKERIYQ